jgi:hypothetical protein
MTSGPQETRPRAPWHLWVVGIVSLLWNAMGAVDYLMTETKNPVYMAKFTQEQLDYFYGFPAWVVSAWAIAVWGALLASLLLLFRRAAAYGLFVVSLLGLVITMYYDFVLTDGLRIMGGPGPAAFTAVIAVVAVLLIVYSARQRKRGVLV